MDFQMMRVQSLSEGGIAEVPAQYIQPPEERPPISDDLRVIDNSDEDNVPMIDVFGFDSEQRDTVCKLIGDACAQWGAFHITNHGVPVELLDQIRGVGLSFFKDCPVKDKLKYACDPNSPASQGYGSKMLRPKAEAEAETSTVLDWRDYFDHHTLPLSRRDPSRWPHFPSNYRQVVAHYSDELKLVAQKLLGLISESLGLPTSCIEDAVGEFYQNITISYYPACPQPHLTLGLQSHSDMGAITLLIQDHVGGLQILKDSRWITVHPQSHSILVILADQMEIITNGKYRSAQHRAITNSSSPRLSVATFHDPAKTVKISPAFELTRNSSPPKYREVKYGDYVSSWYTKGPKGKRNIDALLINC
ncbi:hypothetical protein D5086_021200 [Populus alba]|uniref:Uncharacterized protein n=2 Tax=Populus alba TaxID=43335 RepID=A0ACC4BCX3_POPAL|nr:probable 2-oxoglutarate-dependent dioxygenase At3g111800 [Populus alba]TKR91292.1 leucoanthocyanidin dioxygenase [Populus alba]